jgi:UDP-N-acetylglucosamine 3-dehydrogenase
MSTYTAAIVGLTGIGFARPAEPEGWPISGGMPRSHAAAYHRHPQTEVVAVCDIRQEALDAFRREWGDVWPDVRLYTDYRAMLEQEHPDLVSVCTPDHLHADITVDAARSGAKAILCEKPIATTLADADRMIAAAEENGVLLSIEHTRRWAPIYLTARELIRSGRFGALRTITSSMYGARSMLFRNGTHFVDVICFFAEAAPSWVFAELEEGFDHFTEYKSDGGHDPKTDPAASAYVHFENGVRAFYNSVKTEMPGAQLELVCDGARIEITDTGLTVIQAGSVAEWTRAAVPIEDYMHTFQLAALGELVSVLEQGGSLISPAPAARRTLEIMLAMLSSHERGNVRVDLPLER